MGTAENVFFRKDLGGSPPGVDFYGHAAIQDPYQHISNGQYKAVLVWLGEVAALEIHVPQWRFDSSLEPANPDRTVLDPEPDPGI